MLGPGDEISVRKLQKRREDIRRRDALWRQMAVRVERGGHDHRGADNFADTGQQIAFAILDTARHHRAMQAKHHALHRQCCAKLVEDLIAQRLVDILAQIAPGFSPGGGALDQRESLTPRPRPQHRDHRRTQRRRFGMRTGACIERGLKRKPVCGHG